MKIAKKIILSLTIVFTMAIAFVIGCIGNNTSKAGGYIAPSNSADKSQNEVVVNKPAQKPASYTFKPGEVVVQKGGNTINYNYSPSVNQHEEATAPTVAYEYIFGNTMHNAAAVNLKEIDTTDVNVSYVWSTTRLNTAEQINAKTNYVCQTLANYGDSIYIYVLVSPINTTIPVTFTSSIRWYLGVPKQQQIVNNVTGEVTTQTIVSGQNIDKNTLTTPTSFTQTEKDYQGNDIQVTYYLDGWFLDKDYTQMVETDEVKPGQNVYARYHNIPFGRTDIMTYSENGYTLNQCYASSYSPETYKLPSYNPVIPTIYDDGVNGSANVVAIGDNAFGTNIDGGMPIVTLQLPSTITSIGNNAFASCNKLTSINLPEGLTTIGDYCFSSSNITEIVIPNSVTTIGWSAFQGSKIRHLTIPSSVTTMGGYEQFSGCTNLVSIDLSQCSAYIPSWNDFGGCTSLTTVKLPSNLTSLPYAMFNGCTSLKSFTIPSSVTSIGRPPFHNCPNLTNVTFEQGGQWTYKESSSGTTTNYTIVAGTNYVNYFASAEYSDHIGDWKKVS